jgi:hypothetical protein
MGASTEMWDRNEIQKKYGYITGLTNVVRDKSPEGTWQHNMVAGSTTDDTRWKFFVGQYLKDKKGDLAARNFSTFIVDYYHDLLENLNGNKAKNSTDQWDLEMDKVNWIKEWARVALAYGKDEQEFAIAQNRFYGGEMSCAGMLYASMFGLISESADEAYRLAFEHCFFDIGYARDISSLISVLTFNAIHIDNIASLIEESMFVDPYKYIDSRLIGRLSMSMLQEVKSIINTEIILPNPDELADTPHNYQGSREEWFVQSVIYSRLADRQMPIAFHAGEIWQILIAGLEFGQGDFLKTMQFIVNYGRDNDTVAAAAGMILGAQLGFEKLPKELKGQVLKVSKETMGLDIEGLAEMVAFSTPSF